MGTPLQTAPMCLEHNQSSGPSSYSRPAPAEIRGPVCSESGNSRSSLNAALSILEAEAAQFGIRAINDSKVRLNYLKEIKGYSKEILDLVSRGEISVHDGHQLAYEMRGTILDASRLKTSDIGRAYAQSLKFKNPMLEELYSKYAKDFFDSSFDDLSIKQRNRIKLEIIESAGRDRPKVTNKARKLGKLGKGLWVLTIGLAVYNVTTAEDKVKASAKEGSTVFGGIAGGAAAGAATGLVCGPGAVVCSSVLVIAGGALGALGMEYVFDWVWK